MKQEIYRFTAHTNCPPGEYLAIFTNSKVFKYPRKNKNKLERKKIKLCIPKGIKNGTKLRIKNHGNTPINSSISGDLYVLLTGDFLPKTQMSVALFAYFLYFINAFQFLRKLRLARQTDQKNALTKNEVSK